MSDQLREYLSWITQQGAPFDVAVAEHLARFPVSIDEFVRGDDYLGLKEVYPAVIESLIELYHPHVDGLGPLRIGTHYRESVLTGAIGCAKTYTAVLGLLYGIYLLSCLRRPHALFGLDDNSEIVFLIQSIRIQTGGVAYKLAREIIDGSRFFTKSFPRNCRVKNEMLLPGNIVIRPVSGDQTAAIGMNVVSVVLDEMSYMRYHAKSVNAEDGGEYDQAMALYSATRARIDSRFNKLGRCLIPMFLVGSVRHNDDFIQSKVRDHNHLTASGEDSGVHVYNRRLWDIKPWEYPSGETFRVFKGEGILAPQIVTASSKLYWSENVVDVPVELEVAFKAQSINAALRDLCGVASAHSGNFVVEPKRASESFNRVNLFTTENITFRGNDLPSMKTSEFESLRKDVPWFCHLDLSRTTDSSGLALGYVDGCKHNRPQIIVAGILEVRPVVGYVIPWDAIMYFLFRLSDHVPLRAVSADQVGYNYLGEQLVPYGYKISRISDDPTSKIYHDFLGTLYEGDISIASHERTIAELLALNVCDKTGKVVKPAGGSKDCIDAVVGLVRLIKRLPSHRHELYTWRRPIPPQQKKSSDGSYSIDGDYSKKSAMKVVTIE